MKFEIKGMHCKSCKALIEDAMEELGASIKSFDIDEATQIGILEVDSDKSANDIVSTIEAEGKYKVSVK